MPRNVSVTRFVGVDVGSNVCVNLRVFACIDRGADA